MNKRNQFLDWNWKAKEKEKIIYEDALYVLEKLMKKNKKMEKEKQKTNNKKQKTKKIILDLGCGFGRFTKELSKYGKVISLDVFLKPLKFVKKLGSPTILGEGENIPIKSSTIDLVFCTEVLPYGDYERILDETYRILKKNGIVFLSVEEKYGAILTDDIKKSEIKNAIFKGEVKHAKYFEENEIQKIVKRKRFKIIFKDKIGFTYSGIFSRFFSKRDDKLARLLEHISKKDKVLKNLSRAIVIIAKK